MTQPEESSKPTDQESRALVVRSDVPAMASYSEYRPMLRNDFFFCCAYCGLAEFEASGIAFQIDHYEPVSFRPDLENFYANLLYSCDECNRLKGDLTPPPEARKAGYAVFRPDEHYWDDHFEPDNRRIKHRSKIGEFSIDVLNLNRHSLMRLRDIRERLYQCDDMVVKGLMALRSYRLDQLPPQIRQSAKSAIDRIGLGAGEMADRIDNVLKLAARSPLLEDDPEKPHRMNERAQHIALGKSLFPGTWRGRETKKKR